MSQVIEMEGGDKLLTKGEPDNTETNVDNITNTSVHQSQNGLINDGFILEDEPTPSIPPRQPIQSKTVLRPINLSSVVANEQPSEQTTDQSSKHATPDKTDETVHFYETGETPEDTKQLDEVASVYDYEVPHVYEETAVPKEHPENGCIQNVQETLSSIYENNKEKLKSMIYAILIAAYSAYFAYAMFNSLEGEDSIRLLWVTMFALFCVIVAFAKGNWGIAIKENIISPVTNFVERHFLIFKWIFIIIVLGVVIAFLVVEVAIPDPRNLQSLSGTVIYVLLFYIFSTNPAKVKWRPVLWGLGIQFFLAIIILRTVWGYDAFSWLGARVQEFLQHANAGSIFVFGETYTDHMFAFQVLPVVVYFSTVISVLYYLGVMQTVILKLAWVMQRTLGTTAAESVNAAGNIFIGQTEAPLLIRPFIEKMTKSELHAVMTGGFATIAGSVMATYILFGVPANHLITASVMAAPTALALSKLACPEVEKSETTEGNVQELAAPNQRNVIEAASSGASDSIVLVANIAANLIAFVALLEFVNATLAWIGARAGFGPPENPALSFQFICSYIMWPFAFIMGVDAGDCRKVAELIGYKTFINEFIAYSNLGVFISNRHTFETYKEQHPDGSWTYVNDNIYLKATNTTLVGGVMAVRSEVISTYALCGFANISSVGMVIGGLSAIAPNRRPEIAQLVVRAMLVGTAVSFLNACTAGMLYQGI